MATRLRNLRVTKVALVALGANQHADVLLFKAEWTAAQINTFPDSSFAHISPGGTKDEEGKTVPRSLRHLPYRDAQGEPDAAHVRNALARLSMTDIPVAAKAQARRKLVAAAQGLGITVSEKASKGMYTDDGPMTTAQILERQEWYEQWCTLRWAFINSIDSILDHGEDVDQGAMLLQSVMEFAEQAKTLLGHMEMVEKAQPLFVELAEVQKAGRVIAASRLQKLQDAIALLHAILAEAMGVDEEPATKGRRMADKPDKSDETVLKRAEIAEARVAALETELTSVRKELTDLRESLKPPPTEEEFLKTLPESLRKKWEDNERRLQEAEAVAKAEKAQREQQEYIQKTVSYRAVGLAPDDWDVLKAIDGLDEKPRTRLLQLLKSAEAVIKQSALLTELGAVGGGSGEGTAYAAIEALAMELMKSGTVTKEQAIVKALDVRPELARQYRAERKEAMNGC